jgi:hypothetical protein
MTIVGAFVSFGEGHTAVAEPETRFFIVHLQKTAGTSLRDRFRATLPETAIYPNASDGRDKRISVISVQHLLQRWEERKDEIRLVAGHFPLSTIELLDAPFVTLSILRPPVERTVSYLRHQRRINRDDRDLPLETIYDDPFRFNGLIRNHMVRMFSIGADEMTAGDGVLTDVADSPERLERAKAAVAGLDAFGLQPHFEEFWGEFARRHGLVLGNPLRSNASEPEEPSDALVARIEEDNALDLALYEYAERVYMERRAQRPGAISTSS